MSPPSRRPTKGFDVIRWIETHCVHTQGEWVGKPFRLFDWQRQLILELFTVRAEVVRVFVEL